MLSQFNILKGAFVVVIQTALLKLFGLLVVVYEVSAVISIKSSFNHKGCKNEHKDKNYNCVKVYSGSLPRFFWSNITWAVAGEDVHVQSCWLIVKKMAATS